MTENVAYWVMASLALWVFLMLGLIQWRLSILTRHAEAAWQQYLDRQPTDNTEWIT